MSICHHCGKKIEGEGSAVRVDTYEVRVHDYCRRWYGSRPLTARAIERDQPDVDGDPVHAYVLPGEVNLDPDAIEPGDEPWDRDDNDGDDAR